MINTGRIFDILSFNIAQDFLIKGANVVVQAGNNQLEREGDTYLLKKSGAIYGKFPVNQGPLLFTHLSNKVTEDMVDDR